MSEGCGYRAYLESKVFRRIGDEREPAELARLRRLPEPELLETAVKAGVDPDATANDFNRPSSDLALRPVYFASEEDRQLYDRTIRHPAFTGSVAFTFVANLLGVATERQLRIDYEHTPPWPYFDTESGQTRIGWPNSRWEVHVRAPSTEARRASRRQDRAELSDGWTQLFQDDVGALFGDAEDAIYAEIDRLCREEDARRRVEIA